MEGMGKKTRNRPPPRPREREETPLGRRKEGSGLGFILPSSSLVGGGVEADVCRNGMGKDGNGTSAMERREVALRRAEAMKLKQFQHDRHRRRIPGTGKPFPYRAKATQLGVECPGLGLYFASLPLYVAVLLLLGIMAIYNVVDNYRADNFSETYQVQVNDTRETSTCHRNYAVTNFVLRGTIGNFCDDTRTSDPFACPAICTAAEEEDPACVEPTREGDEREQDGLCEAFPPCAGERKTCCCAMELDVEKSKTPTKAQYWIMYASLCAYCAWLVLLFHVEKKKATKYRASVVSPVDYTLLIKTRSKKSRPLDNRTLYEFFSHYGPVANATFVLKLGNLLEKADRLHKLDVAHREAANAVLARRSCWRIHRHRAAKLARRVLEMKEELEREENVPLQCKDMAFVSFDQEHHANNCIRDHRSTWWESLRILLGRMEKPGARFEGKPLEVKQAPDPSDIRWENADVSRASIRRRRGISYGTVGLIIAGGAVGQFYLESWGTDIRLEINQEFREGSGYNESIPLYALSFVSGLVVVVVNMMATGVAIYLTPYERWLTKTEEESWLAIKLSLAYLLNAALMPIVAANRRPESMYASGGLAELAVFVQVLNAFMPDLYSVVQPDTRLYQEFRWRWISTQEKMNELFEPNKFKLSVHYASIVKTLGLAYLYAPILPIGYFIGFVGLCFTYCVDRYVALRLTRMPWRLEDQIATYARTSLWLLAPLQFVLAHFIYGFKDQDGWSLVFWLGIGTWAAVSAMYWGGLFGGGRDRGLEDSGTHGLKYDHAAKDLVLTWEALVEEKTAAGGLEGLNDFERIVVSHNDLYTPPLPAMLPYQLTNGVVAHYQPNKTVFPHNETLLPGQRPETGGEHSRPVPVGDHSEVNGEP
eukprot:scaffold148_cov341-Pavlova_lutheri.AAC.16